MKKIFILIVFLAAGKIWAQAPDWNQRLQITQAVDSVVSAYIKTASLTELGQMEYSTNIINQYRALFLSGATVYDDITPNPDPRLNPAIIKQVPRDISLERYVQQITELYPQAPRIKVTNIHIIYPDKDAADQRIRVMIKKDITGMLAAGSYAWDKTMSLSMENRDILETLILKPNRQFSMVRIEKIEGGQSNIKIDFPPPPPPDSVFYFHLNLLSGMASVNLDSISRGILDKGHDEMVDERSGVGAINTRAGFYYGFNTGGEIFFGKSRKIGIGAGISYIAGSGTLAVDSYRAEFLAFENNNDKTVFRRIITADKVEETYKFNHLLVPIYLKYKSAISTKTRWYVSLGAGFGSWKVTSVSDAQFDYEGVYSYDDDGNPIYRKDNTTTDWRITQEQASQKDGDANKYFQDKYNQGYNMALDKTVTETRTQKGSTSFLLIQPGIMQAIGDKLDLNIGLNLLLGTSKGSFGKTYKMTDMHDRHVIDYQSVFQGTPVVHHAYFGLNLGLSYRIR
jgi:hypothetical protein